MITLLLLPMAVHTVKAFVIRSEFDTKVAPTTLLHANPWRIPDASTVPSLIEETLDQMNNAAVPADFQPLTKEERIAQRRSVQNIPNVPLFSELGGTLMRLPHPTILQINIGLYCNQACHHCHVESSPLRKEEMMSLEVLTRCLELLKNTPTITTLDITGGAPELHPLFRYFVAAARSLRPHPDDLKIIDRCNLTVLYEPGQGAELIQFLKDHRVDIVASLPCYSQANVDQQRGKGVFERSIAALLALNEAGYGTLSLNKPEDTFDVNAPSIHKLDLVYNPSGAFLPPPQEQLREQYKERLWTDFEIVFDDLYTITNMPIQRFADYLYRRQELVDYMRLLADSYNPDTLPNVMCRNTISVRYDGRLYDCDFNQQLDIPIRNAQGTALTIFDIAHLDELVPYSIRTAQHCYGCTAGKGSSCQGATV